jgi:3D (Asp-Asp-Asp) domain-containing protein
VWIKGFGWVRVDDRLPRGRANRIDLRFGSHSRALAWGKQKRWVRVGR